MGQKKVIAKTRSIEPTNKQANTTNGSEKYHRAFEGNRTNKQTNGTNGSEEGHKRNQVNEIQQLNKQTEQIGQKKVIKETRSV